MFYLNANESSSSSLYLQRYGYSKKKRQNKKEKQNDHMLIQNPTEIDLQSTYGNYKSTLQALAQKIGDIEQNQEEHKYVFASSTFHNSLSFLFSPLSFSSSLPFKTA